MYLTVCATLNLQMMYCMWNYSTLCYQFNIFIVIKIYFKMTFYLTYKCDSLTQYFVLKTSMAIAI